MINPLQPTTLTSRELLKLYKKRHFIRHFALDWILAGAPEFTDSQDYYKVMEQYRCEYGYLMASDLSKKLKKLLDNNRDDNTVSYSPSRTVGKYGHAVLYMFETPSFYIAAHCETRRGSQWSYLDKEDLSPATDAFYIDEAQRLPRAKALELAAFFRSLWWQIIQPELQDFLNDHPDQRKQKFVDELRKEFA
jgi:hypothetical protein